VPNVVLPHALLSAAIAALSNHISKLCYGGILTTATHALPSCTHIVSEFLNAIGRAEYIAPLFLNVCPLFLPLRRVVDGRMSMVYYKEGQIQCRRQETTGSGNQPALTTRP
jgi:hypothetical protein